MAVIGNIAVMISANAVPFARGVDTAVSKLSGLGKGVAGIAGKFGAMAAGMIGVAGAAGMGLLVKNSLESLDATSKLAASLGMETSALLGLQHAADLSGVSLSDLTLGMNRLARQGISIFAVADAIAATNDPTERANIAFKTLGKSGQNLIPLLSAGGDELRKMVEEGERLSGVKGLDVKTIEEANDAVTRVQAAFKGVANVIAISVAPVLLSIANQSAELVPAFGAVATGIMSMVLPVVEAVSNVALSFGMWVSNLGAVVPAIAAAIGVMVSLVVVMKAVATAQTLVLALSGPKGWAILAAGAAIGVAAYIAVDKQMGKVVTQAQAATAEVKANGNAAGEAARKTLAMEAAQKRMAAGLQTATNRFRSLRDEIQVLAAPESMKPFVEINQELLKLRQAGAPMQAIAGVRAMLLERQRLLELQKQEADEEDRIKRAMEDEADLAQRLADEEENRVKGLQDRAAQLMDEMKTPFDQLQDKLAEIQQLFAEGIINKAQMDKLSQFTQQRFEEDQAVGGKAGDIGEVAATGAVQRGSSEAFSSVFAAMRNSSGNGMQSLAKSSEKNAENSTKIAASTKQTASAVAKLEAKMPTFVAGSV